MRITFTGKQDKLAPSQERKLATAFARLSKLIERKGEKGAQVALSTERHRQMAEVRVNFYDQTLIGQGSGTDQFTALMDALEKVEKQAAKSREKWRLAKRDTPARQARTTGEPQPAPIPEEAPQKAADFAPRARKKGARSAQPAKVVQARESERKPMSVEEAMMALEEEQDYVVYRDSESDQVRVLIRRRDGKVDLVEA
ncbi:MAG: HPF/RaiA family ribosome-associated protein [Bryobacteraceae bacterium]|jgi:putative sigma-54 modulation protein